MKVHLDQDACVGCGLCVDACPAVFAMDGDVALTKGEDVAPTEEAACQDACDACPVDAITVED